MQNKYTKDRVKRRMLPWLLLVSATIIIYTLYSPYDDNPADDSWQSNIEYNEPQAEDDFIEIADQQENNDDPALQDTETTAKTEGAEKTTGTELTIKTEPKPVITELETVKVEPEKPKPVKISQENQIYWIGKTDNAWEILIRDPKINPTWFAQLHPLHKRLNAPLNSLEILTKETLVNGEVQKNRSQVLAIKTDKWTYFTTRKKGKIRFYDLASLADNPNKNPKFAMDRAPFRYSHITSHFNPRRKHPISRRVRPHQGVDLKGPYGTPIHTTADGIVSFAGRQRGYGKIVIVKHAGPYETRYAHLSAISVSQGQRVRRGQTIGKLGNTGASTGAHLHYEVRVNGEARNPMTIALPAARKAPQMDKSELNSLRNLANNYLSEISRLKNQ